MAKSSWELKQAQSDLPYFERDGEQPLYFPATWEEARDVASAISVAGIPARTEPYGDRFVVYVSAGGADYTQAGKIRDRVLGRTVSKNSSWAKKAQSVNNMMDALGDAEYEYGGETKKLREIIKDLEDSGGKRDQIDAYLGGLFKSQGLPHTRPGYKFGAKQAGFFSDLAAKVRSLFMNLLGLRDSAIGELEQAANQLSTTASAKFAQSIADPEMASKIKEWFELKVAIKEAEDRLAEIKPELQDAFSKADQQTLLVDDILYKANMAAQKRGSYSTAFKEALTKVNAATRAVLEQCFTSTVHEIDMFNLRPVK